MKKSQVIKFITPKFVNLLEIDSEGLSSDCEQDINPWFNFRKPEHDPEPIQKTNK